MKIICDVGQFSSTVAKAPDETSCVLDIKTVHSTRTVTSLKFIKICDENVETTQILVILWKISFTKSLTVYCHAKHWI